jgi:hypothetical protein
MHLSTWSDLRQVKVTQTGNLKTNALNAESGKTISHIKMKSFLRTNAVSPPPETMPQSAGASYDVPMTVIESTQMNWFVIA